MTKAGGAQGRGLVLGQLYPGVGLPGLRALAAQVHAVDGKAQGVQAHKAHHQITCPGRQGIGQEQLSEGVH